MRTTVSLAPLVLLLVPTASAQKVLQAWSGSASGDAFGTSIADAGDLDGDGASDVLVGAPKGAGSGMPYAHGLSGASGAILLDVQTSPSDAQGELGRSVGTTGDVDGDGLADALVGAPLQDYFSVSTAGVAYHATTALVGLDEYGGQKFNERTGYDLDSAGDITGDGVPEVLVGSPGWEGVEYSMGRARVLRWGTGIPLIEVPGTKGSDQTGWGVEGAGDLDLDGVPDVIVADPWFDGGKLDGGRLRAISGATGQQLWQRLGTVDGERLGWSLDAGVDVDGDGRPDVLAGGWDDRAVLLSGADGGTLHTLSGLGPDEDFGDAVALVGDWNQDGVPDIAVGAPGHDPTPALQDAGRVVVFSGATGGLVAFYDGTAAGARQGDALARLADKDGDGAMDLGVGLPGVDEAQVWGSAPSWWTLFDSTSELSAATGGVNAFSLDAGPSFAAETYLLLGSIVGTIPGIPIDGHLLPLNFGPYFLLTLSGPNQPPLANSLGVLDANGAAQASFTAPPVGPAWIGFTFHHAYVVFGAGMGGALAVVHASNAVSHVVTP